MEFSELTTELEKFKDTEDFNNYVGGFINSDRVNKYLEIDEGKKLIQPLLDKYHSKGLESWKQNNLSKLIDEEVKKRYPEKSPKDQELASLKAEIESIKAEKAREELKNKATKTLNEKQLPLSIVDFIIGNDEDTTNTNINKLSDAFTSHINTEIEKRLKNGNYIPPKSDGNNSKLTMDIIRSMSPTEIKERMTEIDEFMKNNK